MQLCCVLCEPFKIRLAMALCGEAHKTLTNSDKRSKSWSGSRGYNGKRGSEFGLKPFYK